jgi:hypothetical protein
VQQAHTAKTRRLSRATSTHSEDQETESCNKLTQRRPGDRVVQQVHTAETSARETTGRATEAVGA